MNYSFQVMVSSTVGADISSPTAWAPDYSSFLSTTTLNETSLVEKFASGGGIKGPPGGAQTIYYCGTTAKTVPFNTDTNFDCSPGGIDASPVTADINRNGFVGDTLNPFNDWPNLVYDFKNTFDFADGVHLTIPSSREAPAATLFVGGVDTDGDGVLDASDNCPFVKDADQKDANHNGIGDACEIVPILECVRKVRCDRDDGRGGDGDRDDRDCYCRGRGPMFKAIFGHQNHSLATFVAVGANNDVSVRERRSGLDPAADPQPIQFLTGLQKRVFSGCFDGDDAGTGELNGASAVANRHSRDC